MKPTPARKQNRLDTAQAVILAGGMATRLGELTHQLPKSMLRFYDKPFLQYQLELLKDSGFRCILLCLGYLGSQIEDYFKDGGWLGLQITYSYEDKPLGTAGALKKAEKLLDGQFFTIYGDSYVFLDFEAVWKFFGSKDKLALMTVYQNENRYDTSNTTIRDGLVESYDKKQPVAEMRHIEYGVNLFRKEVLAMIPEGTPYGLEDLFPHLIASRQLLAYEAKERFYEIGSLRGIEEFRGYAGGQK